MPTWNVYILRCADGTLYTGISTDICKRIVAHNTGKGAKYTRARLPVTLVWHEEKESEGDARKREIEIKKLQKYEKEFLIIS
ncbi:MAG: GIY-YIG nuclease family protein [Patescibacteria group bacterium]|jgi:putative endonuclease